MSDSSTSSVSDLGHSALREKHLPVLPSHIHLYSKVKLWCKGLVRYWWAWELLAAALSIVATIVLIVILRINDGQPQQSFSFGAAQFSLNALIAAISTVVRASLLVATAGALNQSSWNWFLSPPRSNRSPPSKPLKDLDTFGDAASDSLASIKLLFRTKGRALASLGAVITILSLAFDTFSQQILTTEPQTIGSNDPGPNLSASAFLPRSTSYTGKVINDAEVLQGATFDTYGTLMPSIFTNNVTLPGGTCSTGNCTWPTTPTLGICSSCNDAKSRLTKTTNSTEITYTLQWPEVFTGPQTNLLFERSAQSTNLTFNITLENDSLTLAILSHADPVLNLTSDGRLVISSFNLLGIPAANWDKYNGVLDPSFESDVLAAYQCIFYFCAQAFSANTTAGEPRQELVSTWDKWEDPWVGFVPGVSPEVNGIPYNTEAFRVMAEAPAVMNIASSSAFQVDMDSMRGLAYAFGSILGGDGSTYGTAIGLTLPGPVYNGTRIDTTQSNGPQNQPPSYWDANVLDNTIFAETFWKASNSTETISALAQRMADGFMSYMRTSMPAALDQRYAPTIFTTVTLIRVRWEWLIFPLGLLLAGHAFLVATIWQTKRRAVKPWKGHRVPLLLASIDDVVRRLAAGGFESRTGLEERVGEMRVRLEYDNGDEIVFRRV